MEKSRLQRFWHHNALIISLMALTLFGIVLITATAHMVYVAIKSQPDCIAHHKTVQADQGQFKAAKSSC